MSGIYDIDLDIDTSYSKVFTFRDHDENLINLTGYTASFIFRDKYGDNVVATYTIDGVHVVNGNAAGTLTLNLTITEVNALKEGYYRLILTDTAANTIVALEGTVSINLADKSNLLYLIPELRLTLGDTASASYRYTDDWLKVALVAAVKKLGKWWRWKYLISEQGVVSRSPYYTFDLESPPIIQTSDEAIIILMAAIIILQGSLENAAWNLASWRDAEIAYSNLESGRIRDANLQRFWNDLTTLLKPPSKRLAWSVGYPLPGYQDNEYENKTKP